MKQPDTVFDGLAATKTLNDNVGSVKFKVSTPPERINLSIPITLSDCHKDAKGMAKILRTMKSGTPTYQRVFKALELKYGLQFKKDFYREVHRG